MTVTDPSTAPRWLPPALRSRVFRWYWAAQWPTQLGTWMHIVALGYLVFKQTGSTGAVALVAAADGLPAVALALVGGLVADRYPRRSILLVTQTVLGLSAGALAVLVWTHHATLPVILVVAVIFGATNDAFDLPARQALIADVVDRSVIVNAMALSSSAMSATRIVGPSLAGVIIATAGPAACFAFLSVAYLAPIAALVFVIPSIPPVTDAGRRGAVADMVGGFRAATSSPVLRATLIVGGVLALLGVSYMPYLPVIAINRLGGSPHVLGLMYSVGGIGGLVGGLLLSLLRGTRRRALLTAGGILYAVSLVVVAQSSTLLLTLPALVGISFGFVAINTSLTTLLQTEAPPAMRGRILGLYATLFAGAQPLGTLAYGGLAGVFGLFNVIAVGALVVGSTAVAVAATGAFRSVDVPVGQPAARPKGPGKGAKGLTDPGRRTELGGHQDRRR